MIESGLFDINSNIDRAKSTMTFTHLVMDQKRSLLKAAAAEPDNTATPANTGNDTNIKVRPKIDICQNGEK